MLTFSRLRWIGVSLAAGASMASPIVGIASAQAPAVVQTSATAPGVGSAAFSASVNQIAGTPGVPEPVGSTLAQLLSALNGPTPPSGAQVAALLQELAQTQGLPPQAASALNALANTVAGGHVPTPSDLTGALADLVDQAASTPGLPAPAPSTLTALASSLRSSNPPGLSQVANQLRRVAGSQGVPTPVAAALNGLADAVAGPAGANGSSGGNGTSSRDGTNGANGIPGFNGSNPFGPGFNPASPLASGAKDSPAVRAAGIVIRSVRYNARRRTVAVVVQCNAHGKGCNTAVAVYRGRTRTGRPVARTIAQQHRATFTLHLSKALARTIARRGAVLRAVAVSNTPFGQSHSAKSLRIKRAHK